MKKKLIIIGGIILIGLLLFIGQNRAMEERTKNHLTADKIEVFHFHGTQQCWSCIAVGDYAEKTIQLKFPQEYSNAKITFRSVNVDLPQNKEIVEKYQARGSSLYINTIIDSKDHIEEDVTVWRLVNNRTRFMNYLEDKLSGLLSNKK
ncbi:MAG: nitrophenyl compound nitroreductase subunit ArsF family protein [Candidatus Paceibacterota bacterium]|jgi:hypothetical protein